MTTFLTKEKRAASERGKEKRDPEGKRQKTEDCPLAPAGTHLPLSSLN